MKKKLNKKKCFECEKLRVTKKVELYEDADPNQPIGKKNVCKKCCDELEHV